MPFPPDGHASSWNVYALPWIVVGIALVVLAAGVYERPGGDLVRGFRGDVAGAVCRRGWVVGARGAWGGLPPAGLDLRLHGHCPPPRRQAPDDPSPGLRRSRALRPHHALHQWRGQLASGARVGLVSGGWPGACPFPRLLLHGAPRPVAGGIDRAAPYDGPAAPPPHLPAHADLRGRLSSRHRLPADVRRGVAAAR